MKQFWLWDAPAKEEQLSLVALFLRVTIGFTMLTHGFVKLVDFNTLSAVFPDPIGIGRIPSLALSTFAEVVCSFLLIFGILVRPAALILVINMVVATFLASAGMPFSMKELPLMYLIIYVAITIMGGGRFSLDWILFTKKSDPIGRRCRNMTHFDRVLRLFIALILWFFVLNGFVMGVAAVFLMILSVPLLITSFWGYCGLYDIIKKKNSCR